MYDILYDHCTLFRPSVRTWKEVAVAHFTRGFSSFDPQNSCGHLCLSGNHQGIFNWSIEVGNEPHEQGVGQIS